jgi:hypothetical protein
MAAGLGFKTFTTGEVLTAADVNGYLMQGVLVFASAAARNAAITSPQEGQFAFTKDTNGLWYYDGAAWVASGATGDIEGVTAGVGITGGGTSGTVTITNDMATTITAAGDIVVGTGSGTYDNLPIGTTGQILTADTTVSPYKVKWASAAAGGGWQVVKAETTFTSVATTGTTFDSIFSSSYNYYMVEIKALGGGTAATDDLQLQMLYSGTTQAAGYYGTTFGNAHGGASPASVGTSGASQFTVSPDASGSATSGDRITGVINFYQCHGTSATAAWQGQLLQGYNFANYVFAGQSSTARTYTGFLLKASSGNISGTLAVYGLA